MLSLPSEPIPTLQATCLLTYYYFPICQGRVCCLYLVFSLLPILGRPMHCSILLPGSATLPRVGRMVFIVYTVRDYAATTCNSMPFLPFFHVVCHSATGSAVAVPSPANTFPYFSTHYSGGGASPSVGWLGQEELDRRQGLPVCILGGVTIQALCHFALPTFPICNIPMFSASALGRPRCHSHPIPSFHLLFIPCHYLLLL